MKPQPPTILVHFEDLETLLMTSKCALFYEHLSYHAYPCLNKAHRMFVYFMSQKCGTPSRRPLCWRLGAYTPAPYPALLFDIIMIIKSITDYENLTQYAVIYEGGHVGQRDKGVSKVPFHACILHRRQVYIRQRHPTLFCMKQTKMYVTCPFSLS